MLNLLVSHEESSGTLAWITINLSDELNMQKQSECVGIECISSEEQVMIAMSSGELITVHVDHKTVEIVDELIDDQPEKSGVLALRSSDAGDTLVVVSPVQDVTSHE